MKGSVREDLLRSLNRLSIVGSVVMSFVVALVVLSYMGLDFGMSLLLSLLFSALVGLSRIAEVFVRKQ